VKSVEIDLEGLGREVRAEYMVKRDRRDGRKTKVNEEGEEDKQE
jgi:hypothetical protein